MSSRDERVGHAHNPHRGSPCFEASPSSVSRWFTSRRRTSYRRARASARSWRDSWAKLRLAGGNLLRGRSYLSETASKQPRYNGYPTKKGIDLVIRRLRAATPALEGLVGRLCVDWDFSSASAYLYPARTQLSWQKDAAERSSAYIFYAHPR
jgi:hypothetical protein